MQTSFYHLSPIEFIKVTPQNLNEVAEWCGGKVAKTASRRVEGRMDSYVWVPTPKGSKLSWAFPGMFITKRLVVNAKNEIKHTFSVFRRDYFDKNYFATPEVALRNTWGRLPEADRPTSASTPSDAVAKLVAGGEEVPSVPPTMGNVVGALNAAGITADTSGNTGMYLSNGQVDIQHHAALAVQNALNRDAYQERIH